MEITIIKDAEGRLGVRIRGVKDKTEAIGTLLMVAISLTTEQPEEQSKLVVPDKSLITL